MYQVNGDIAIADSVERYGTQSGIAVVKARDAYAIRIHNASPVTHVSIKYLYLDGIRVEFEGRSTNNITIRGLRILFIAKSRNSKQCLEETVENG